MRLFVPAVLLLLIVCLAGCKTHHPTTPIYDISMLVGRPFPDVERRVTSLPNAGVSTISSIDPNPDLQNGTERDFKIDGGMTLQLWIGKSGIVRRVCVLDAKALNYGLSDAKDLFARFGFQRLPDADVPAETAFRWNDVGGDKLAAITDEPGGEIWQIQAEQN